MQVQLLWSWDLLERVKWRSADPNHRNSINKYKGNALGWLATYEKWYGSKWMENKYWPSISISVVTDWTPTFPLVEISCDLIEN